MSHDSTPHLKWAIGDGCPKGAMYIGADGEPKITPYGLGWLAAEAAKDQGMTLHQAINYVAQVCANHFAGSPERGFSEKHAKSRANEVRDSAMQSQGLNCHTTIILPR